MAPHSLALVVAGPSVKANPDHLASPAAHWWSNAVALDFAAAPLQHNGSNLGFDFENIEIVQLVAQMQEHPHAEWASGIVALWKLGLRRARLVENLRAEMMAAPTTDVCVVLAPQARRSEYS